MEKENILRRFRDLTQADRSVCILHRNRMDRYVVFCSPKKETAQRQCLPDLTENEAQSGRKDNGLWNRPFESEKDNKGKRTGDQRLP